ncbi:hypothetical protein RE474_03285 [Methanolobus sediminis]|uniref:Lipoprotein n=1 Tax=Methanolobus sediminis TaxID=3072978 RepID=A0AA51UNV2_9EURY|nr:hypothetical protein [Methanolobus sediminis]WMW25756.1 hypothetical protein RE474_03285 [Methanolobus sediminis]
MKKLLIICILIACLLFSGCVGNEDESTSETSEIGQVPDLIIKPSDVPGFTLDDYTFLAVSKSNSYEFGNSTTPYTDTLPSGTRNVGETSVWSDATEHKISCSIEKYDSDIGLTEYIDKEEEAASKSGHTYGTCTIGDICFYRYVEPYPGIIITWLSVITSNNELIRVTIVDENDKSLDEAIRIATIIEGRVLSD